MAELPTTIGEIWADHTRTRRWHEIWVEHLRLQDHPDVAAYQQAAAAYAASEPHLTNAIDTHTTNAMQVARHEVVAALEAFNAAAGATMAHTGLASSDITDVATQGAILDSLLLITEHAVAVASRLRALMVEYAELKLVARTHGQPAQLTTWGHRQATILAPLLDWIDLACDTAVGYPMRPPVGAVGTWADLKRVLGGWRSLGEGSATHPGATGSVSTTGEVFVAPAETPFPGGPRGGERGGNGGLGPLDQHAAQLQARLGFRVSMDASRQVYHRSYDLQIAGLINQLASIAQTWATDRRLESMLGLGNERHLTEQSASSSMAHKSNPRFAERVCGLVVVTRGYSNMCAELAGMEWLEGDVSTSAARKLVLPALFQAIDDVLSNWAHVIDLWQVDKRAIKDEVWIHRYEWATPAIMQAMVDAGVSRASAHRALREAWAQARRESQAEDIAETFETELCEAWDEAGAPQHMHVSWLRGVVGDLLAEPIGNVADQIDYLDRRAHRAIGLIQAGREWHPEVRP